MNLRLQQYVDFHDTPQEQETAQGTPEVQLGVPSSSPTRPSARAVDQWVHSDARAWNRCENVQGRSFWHLLTTTLRF